MEPEPRYLTFAVACIGVALIAAGPAALLDPERAASAFGIPAEDPQARAYLLASATRDLALGLSLVATTRVRSHGRRLAWVLFALALVAAGDATNVAAYVGWPGASSLIVHIGSLFVLVALGYRLWRA